MTEVHLAYNVLKGLVCVYVCVQHSPVLQLLRWCHLPTCWHVNGCWLVQQHCVSAGDSLGGELMGYRFFGSMFLQHVPVISQQLQVISTVLSHVLRGQRVCWL